MTRRPRAERAGFWAHCRACAAALAVALLVAPPPGARAQERSLVLQDFASELRVDSAGTLTVTEALQPRFTGSWNGILRDVPLAYRTPEGLAGRLHLEVLGVHDGSGAPLRVEEERDRRTLHLKIYVPGARDAVRTVVLRYRVDDAVLFFDDHDELYWNVTGDSWSIPIEHASARVILPPGVAGLRAGAWSGPYGSRDVSGVRTEKEERGFRFETARALGFHEGMSVAVAWDPGVVSRPTLAEKIWRVLAANLVLLLPLLSLAVMARLWWTRGRDPAAGPLVPRYEPPEAMGPGEGGTLVDDRPDTRDVTAMLVELAVRGWLRIEELGGNRYRFVHLRERSEWTALKEPERLLLEAVFEGRGDEVTTDDLENRFYADLPGIKSALWRSLMEAGCYRRRPDRVRGAWLAVAAGLLVAGIALATPLTANGLLAPLAAFGAALFTPIPVAVFGWLMPARTREGARRLDEVLGFQEFLDRVEEDRFKRVITGPEMFERYLPWAMALGVERRWARAFRDIYRQPPDWYRGGNVGAFNAAVLTANLGGMAHHTAAAMTSAPRSAGGSAFSGGGGGGFSGGGFGGGGGGGF